MASLPTRTTASFAAIAPVPNLTVLDNEFNQYVGASGIFNGGTTGTKLLVKTSDASDPPIEQDQVGAGPLAEWKQNGTLKASIANSGQIVSAVTTGTAPLSVASTTKVTNLNADLLDDLSSAAFAQVASAKVHFSLSWFIDDPSTFPTGVTTELPAFVVPDGGQVVITKSKVLFNDGSHTNGTSLDWAFLRLGVGTFGTVSFTDSNNTINTLYTNDFGDISPSANEIIWPLLSGGVGVATERSVTLILFGYRLIEA